LHAISARAIPSALQSDGRGADFLIFAPQLRAEPPFARRDQIGKLDPTAKLHRLVGGPLSYRLKWPYKTRTY
jgi:hypothetical protein